MSDPGRRRRRGRPRPSAAPARHGPGPLDGFAARPRFTALIGAFCIAFSGIFYRNADVSPSTGTVYRALFGLPLLLLVALAQRRRWVRCRARVRLSAIAGIFFVGDLMTWHHAIE